MNAHAPPTKSEAGGQTGRRAELLVLRRGYHSLNLIQAEVVWNRWEMEAGRLFSLFWRTANERHFRAFVRHVSAMRRLAGRRVL